MALMGLMGGVVLMAVAVSSVAAMRWERRVLVVAADAVDARVLAQRAAVAEMGAEASDRDLVVVEIVGGIVTGASDEAAALRRAYGLPARGFAVALVGKDGGVKLRSGEPVSRVRLMAAIDAMPMRRGRGG